MGAPANASQSRKFQSNLFRRGAATQITTGLALLSGVGASSVTAKTQDVNGQVDLSKPLYGFRFIFKGRVTIGTAAYTSINPESLLQLVNKIRITGNFRGNGKTLLDSSLATLFGHLMQTKFANGFVQNNGVVLSRPGVPYSNIIPVTAQTNDFIISIDVPFAPIGWKRRTGAAFLMRQEDWTNVNVHIECPALPDNAANALGTSAATSTTSLSAFGSGAGAMTVDLYALPVRMGEAAIPLNIPGLCTRVENPITAAVLQSAMANTELLKMDKQSTARVYLKVGIGTAFPIFTALSDTAVTALGVLIGTDTNVKQLVDVQAVRSELQNEYQVPPIQGYFAYDWMGYDENFDAAYPGDALKDNQPFRVVANGPGTANAQGSIMQEEIVVHPFGPLFG